MGEGCGEVSCDACRARLRGCDDTMLLAIATERGTRCRRSPSPRRGAGLALGESSASVSRRCARSCGGGDSDNSGPLESDVVNAVEGDSTIGGSSDGPCRPPRRASLIAATSWGSTPSTPPTGELHRIPLLRLAAVVECARR